VEAGAQIPTEQEMCRRFGVSKTTVRLAVEELVGHGFLTKIQGKGTYVLRSVPEQSIRMAICLNAERDSLRTISAYRIVDEGDDNRECDAIHDAWSGSVERCWRLVRIQAIDSLPLALETYAPQLVRGSAGALRETSPRGCLERRCAARIQQMRERTDMARLTEAEAVLLEVVPGTPAVRIRREFSTVHGQPSGLTVTLHRIDRFSRVLDFERF
jgi:GntR family transcriptional regulator